MLKKIRKILLILLTALIFCIGVLSVLGIFFEEDIKAKILTELNKHLTAEVKVSNTNFSLLKKFPSASIAFNELLINNPEGFKEGDTLIYAQELSLGFDLIKLINGTYELEGIGIENAKVNIQENKLAEYNYKIWESTSSDSTSLSLAIDNVDLQQIDFVFKSEISEFSTETSIDRIQLNGKFKEQEFNLHFDGGIWVEDISMKGEVFLSKQDLNVESDILINISDQWIIFDRTAIAFQDFELNTKGNILTETEELDINIEGNEISFKSVLTSIPIHYTKNLTNHDVDGKVNFNLTIKGSYRESSPTLTSTIELSEGSYKNISENIEVDNIKSILNYTRDEKDNDQITINSFNGIFAKGSLQISGSIENTTDPKGNLNYNFTGEVKELIQEFNIEEFDEASGKYTINGSLVGVLEAQKILENTKGELLLQNLVIQHRKYPKLFQKTTIYASLSNKNIVIHDLNTQVENSQIDFEGVLKNAFDSTKTITVEGILNTDQVNVEEFILANEKSKNTSSSGTRLRNTLHLNLKISTGKLQYKKIVLEDFNGILLCTNHQIKLDKCFWNGMNGTGNANLTIAELKNRELLISGNTQLQNINSSMFFDQLENFDQKIITDQNIKGEISTNANYSFRLDKDLNIKPSTILAVVDFSVKNGVLKEVKSLLEIADYMNENKTLRKIIKPLVFKEKLRSIEFEEIQNSIQISQETIRIPKIEIKSSAMDLKITGTHTFDNQINYGLNFRIAELMTQKKQSEYGYIEDDGLGVRLFLKMTGTVDDPDISYDPEQQNQQQKENFEKEKQNLKSILKHEFNLFKNHNGVKTRGKNSSKTVFEVKWEEEEKQEPTKQRKKKKNRFGKFLNKIGVETLTDTSAIEVNLEEEDDDF